MKRPAIMLLLCSALTACDPFGPETPTTHSIVYGVVTGRADGLPLEGARVFAHMSGWVTYSGEYVRSDTVLTDANGAYHLSTEHFCPADLIVTHQAYGMNITRKLPCTSDPQPIRHDIVMDSVTWCPGMFGVPYAC